MQDSNVTRTWKDTVDFVTQRTKVQGETKIQHTLHEIKFKNKQKILVTCSEISCTMLSCTSEETKENEVNRV